MGTRDARFTMTLDQDRQAAQMKADGFSFRQIGEALGISDKTAKAAVARFEATSKAEERKAQQKLADFQAWLAAGRKQGWVGLVLQAGGGR